MIHVAKDFDHPPRALEDCCQRLMSGLLALKEKHPFDGRCYNNASYQELRLLYARKCAFCESLIYEDDKQNHTVEHYRPKSNGYYWLAYEWSNLLPICFGCNNAKGDKWEVAGHKVKSPPDDQRDYRADSEPMRGEKPRCLHPEIDRPQDFFSLELSGELIPAPASTEADSKRAAWTCDTIGLNRRGLPFKRQKRLDDMRKRIEDGASLLFELYTPAEVSQDPRLIALALRPAFRDARLLADPRAEYSLVGVKLLENLENMERLIWVPLEASIGANLTGWIRNAFATWAADQTAADRSVM